MYFNCELFLICFFYSKTQLFLTSKWLLTKNHLLLKCIPFHNIFWINNNFFLNKKRNKLNLKTPVLLKIIIRIILKLIISISTA